MKKEQILELLKDTIITLQKKRKEFSENDLLRDAWQKQNKRVLKEIKKLGPIEKSWIEHEYEKFYEENILDEVHKLRDSLKNQPE